MWHGEGSQLATKKLKRNRCEKLRKTNLILLFAKPA